MRKGASRTIIVAGLAGIVLVSGLRAHAFAPEPPANQQGGFSPLFARRLEVGLENMDKPAERVHLARLEIVDRPTGAFATPMSGNPASLCLGSACYMSYCFASACIGSRCLGSACLTSGCGGSACLSSGCVGSTCVGSGCVGSACVGSICVGTACVGCTAESDPYQG